MRNQYKSTLSLSRPLYWPKTFQRTKSVLYIEKSAAGQVIISSKSMMTSKRCLITATADIKYNQVISKTSNAESQSIKALTMIITEPITWKIY